MKLSPNQQKFLYDTAGLVGQKFDVSTSWYGVHTDRFKPRAVVNRQSLIGLAKQGFVRIDQEFWRGASVTRLK